jgi:hypothetical protein
MKSGKIISFKTHKALDEKNIKAAENLINKEGHYLGALPETLATTIQNMQDKLTCEKAQIDELIEEFDIHYMEYLNHVTEALIFLGYNPIDFNGEADKLYVSEDGHVWVVKSIFCER